MCIDNSKPSSECACASREFKGFKEKRLNVALPCELAGPWPYTPDDRKEDTIGADYRTLPDSCRGRGRIRSEREIKMNPCDEFMRPQVD